MCLLIAIIAQLIGRSVPLVGAPLFAIGLGVAAANWLPQQLDLASLRIGEVAKNCLKGGIVLMGASLDLGDIVRVSKESLPVMAMTISGGLLCAWYMGRRMRVHWRMQSLIGVGTIIRGASAIAAIAPIARARAEEYSILSLFSCSLLLVI